MGRMGESREKEKTASSTAGRAARPSRAEPGVTDPPTTLREPEMRLNMPPLLAVVGAR